VNITEVRRQSIARVKRGQAVRTMIRGIMSSVFFCGELAESPLHTLLFGFWLKSCGWLFCSIILRLHRSRSGRVSIARSQHVYACALCQAVSSVGTHRAHTLWKPRSSWMIWQAEPRLIFDEHAHCLKQTKQTNSVALSPRELYWLSDRHLSTKFSANFCG
jgi:hypothetical protein